MATHRKLHIPAAAWIKTAQGTLEMRWTLPAERDRKVSTIPFQAAPVSHAVRAFASRAA